RQCQYRYVRGGDRWRLRGREGHRRRSRVRIGRLARIYAPADGDHKLFSRASLGARRDLRFVIRAADIVIVGGGVMGCSLAWHLAIQSRGSASIIIVERDSSYRFASSALSLSSIRQQFTTPVNIEMSRYTLEILRDPSPLMMEGQTPDFQFVERGYLFLGRGDEQAGIEKEYEGQRGCGFDPELTKVPALAGRYPWLHTAHLPYTSHVRARHGQFDAYRQQE